MIYMATYKLQQVKENILFISIYQAAIQGAK